MTQDTTNTAPTNHKPLPLSALVTDPLPGTAIPGELAWSPDDRLITYLGSPDRSLTRALYALAVETGERRALVLPEDFGVTEENIPLEERLRRERVRQRELGITQYAWARGAARILLPLRGELYILDSPESSPRKLMTGTSGPALAPALSPNGALVAYVQGAELYVVPSEGGEGGCEARQLTSGSRGTGKTCGLAEFVAHEEMRRREGFWWSPDSRHLAFVEVDETHIPVYRIAHQGKDTIGDEAQEEHRYPFAGKLNARVRLGVVPAAGGDVVWMDLGEDEDIYLARVAFMPSGKLAAEVQDRSQRRLDLIELDPRTGARRELLCETSDHWVNLHDMFRPLERANHPYAGGFLWASEQTGFMQLYLHDRDGALIRPLTPGSFIVESIAAVDEERQLVYFLGANEDPLSRHLYVVSLDGGEPRQITAGEGLHHAVIDHGFRRFIDIHDARSTGPSVSLRSLADNTLL